MKALEEDDDDELARDLKKTKNEGFIKNDEIKTSREEALAKLRKKDKKDN